MEIIARGLQMERTQLRLGLVIALVITVNSVMLVSSIGNGGQYVIAGLAFASMNPKRRNRARTEIVIDLLLAPS